MRGERSNMGSPPYYLFDFDSYGLFFFLLLAGSQDQ
jgi:hypothetical protein